MITKESRIQNPEYRRTAAKSFEDLLVWQKAHAWVLLVYGLSESFPAKEHYALTSQLRRAAMSVPANIAEGFKKRGVRDKLRFFNIAQGSLEESRYFLILTRDLGYADVRIAQEKLGEVSRLLEAYHRAILNSGF
ncbi:MAG: four helix bundle protein [Verrucomicrobiota bacterium]|nr:four helix bundle protein [Verrucomicrobiota bacterium]